MQVSSVSTASTVKFAPEMTCTAPTCGPAADGAAELEPAACCAPAPALPLRRKNQPPAPSSATTRTPTSATRRTRLLDPPSDASMPSSARSDCSVQYEKGCAGGGGGGGGAAGGAAAAGALAGKTDVRGATTFLAGGADAPGPSTPGASADSALAKRPPMPASSRSAGLSIATVSRWGAGAGAPACAAGA